MSQCSKCEKYIWFFQNRWSLSNVNEKPHDYWHTKCAIPIHELGLTDIDSMNRYIKSITLSQEKN